MTEPGPAPLIDSGIIQYIDRNQCRFCGGESPHTFPFLDHYACIQRYRQLSVRADWAIGPRAAWPDVLLAWRS